MVLFVSEVDVRTTSKDEVQVKIIRCDFKLENSIRIVNPNVA